MTQFQIEFSSRGGELTINEMLQINLQKISLYCLLSLFKKEKKKHTVCFKVICIQKQTEEKKNTENYHVYFGNIMKINKQTNNE